MRHPLALAAAASLLVLGLSPSPVVAAPPAGESAALLARCSRLPVWFNGRVATLDSVSRNLLWALSDADAWRGLDGAPLHPVAWCLDIAVGDIAWMEQPILRVEHPSLVTMLAPDEGADNPPGPRYCSLQQFLEHLGELGEREAALATAAGPPPEELVALQRLFARVGRLRRVLQVLRVIDLHDGEAAKEVLSGAREAEAAAVPLLVPPRKRGEPWWTVPYAAAVLEVGDEAGIEANPAGAHVVGLLRAWAAGNVAACEARLRDYERYLQETGVAASPYQFEPPAGWHEHGIPTRGEQVFFSDLLAHGWTATMLERGGPEDRVTINVSTFAGATAPPDRIVNDWRFSEGLAPVTAAAKGAEPCEVAGGSGWRLTLDGQEPATGAAMQLDGVVFAKEGRTWVVTYRGPRREVELHRPEFETFLRSLRIGPADELANWFQAEPPASRDDRPEYEVLAAVIETADAAWVLQSYLFGSEQPEQRAAELRRLVASLQPGETRVATLDHAGPIALPWTWSLPDGWVAVPGPEGGILRTGNDESLLTWRIVRLARSAPLEIGLLVRHWEEGHQLPPRSDAAREQTIEPVPSAIGRAWVVRLHVPAQVVERPPEQDPTVPK